MIGEQTNLMTIELSDTDAVLFLAFQKNYDNFKLLNENGVFDTKRGSIILHFNTEGKLMKIDREQVMFSTAKI